MADVTNVCSKSPALLPWRFCRHLPPDTHKATAARVIVVPTVHVTDGPDARKLARQRAVEVKKTLQARGITAPIRIASKIRVASDAKAQLRTTLWVRFQV